MKKKIGVLLSGCGVFDGAEIHEATLTLYFLQKAGAEIVCIAPDKPQFHVVDHLISKPTEENRNVLTESARIARGKIHELSSFSADEVDGLILPGGFGAVKNLINYAVKGRDCIIDPDVQRILLQMIDSKKPLGAMCIGPMVVAVAFQNRDEKPILTIGMDDNTASDLESFGAQHQKTKVDEIAVDEKLKIVTTPAYMLGLTIADIALGIEKLVKQIMHWA